MLEEMHITYQKFSTLSNTADLQQTIFDRYVRASKTSVEIQLCLCIFPCIEY